MDSYQTSGRYKVWNYIHVVEIFLILCMIANIIYATIGRIYMSPEYII